MREALLDLTSREPIVASTDSQFKGPAAVFLF